MWLSLVSMNGGDLCSGPGPWISWVEWNFVRDPDRMHVEGYVDKMPVDTLDEVFVLRIHAMLIVLCPGAKVR